ncbi:MAG: phosphoenolpyruvate synthase, partial [Planctomycetes bacterium]|nr:phosphoenolpyruvate synthase [Planctomycetota bacterium]
MTGPRENLRVLPDRDWPAADARSVGGKVAGLVRLAECGCPVPDGFCVTTGAYRSHVECALAGDEDDDHRAAQTASIRRRILDTPIPESLIDEIAEAYAALPAPGAPVAVRSSGTREDTAATAFAGLHDTLLNVRDLPACLAAIRRCWASTWSDRAVAYGRERGLDPHDAGMAVIVQVLVPAGVSGVLFSADPVTGDADRVIIESSWGLGESIVSGRVAPDRFVVSRADLAIVEAHVGDKCRECVPDPTPGPGG